MLELKTFIPKKHSNLIERLWIIHADNYECDLFIPPSPYPNIIISLSEQPVWYSKTPNYSSAAHGMIFKPVKYKVKRDAVYLGIRFSSYGCYPFSCTDDVMPIDCLKEVLIDKDKLTAMRTLYHQGKIEDICQMIFQKMEYCYSAQKEQQIKPIEKLINQIKLDNNKLSIAQFCENENVNYISFYRLFKKVIGVSPKKYERLIKFCKSLDNILRTQDELTDIGLSVGYFDQPHFIKEFKYFMQMTPTEYINTYNNDCYLKGIKNLLKFTIY